ncbi:acyltransferase [uncultured Helicobacter sp.]|uniref:acyltransferase n=1 Tax=uncultured Helicobacter sp. TaxID=175537 RepID=UPI00374F592F
MKEYFAHASSVIDEGASIGRDSKIWHFCHIFGSSVIGANCSIGQNCMIAQNVHIGNNVRIQNNVSVVEGVRIDDDVFIAPSVVFTNIKTPRAFISRKDEYQPTLLERGCSIGANATIICGNTIGAYALIGAGAVVSNDVPPHALVVGNPARLVGWVDKAGVKMEFVHNRAYDSLDSSVYELRNGKVVQIET